MIGVANAPRQPFKMTAGRHAQSRYTFIDSKGKERHSHKSGRASFVWLHGVLIPLACGVTDQVEVSQGRGAPWHKVTGQDDAYRQIMDHYPMQPGIKRLVRSHRTRRGLPLLSS